MDTNLINQFRYVIDIDDFIIDVEKSHKIRYCFPSEMYDDLMALDDITETCYDGIMGLKSKKLEEKYGIKTFCPISWYNIGEKNDFNLIFYLTFFLKCDIITSL